MKFSARPAVRTRAGAVTSAHANFFPRDSDTKSQEWKESFFKYFYFKYLTADFHFFVLFSDPSFELPLLLLGFMHVGLSLGIVKIV